MNLEHATFETGLNLTFIDGYWYLDSRVVACEFSVSMFQSEILERNLPSCFGVDFNAIICRAVQFDLFMFHVWQIHC